MPAATRTTANSAVSMCRDALVRRFQSSPEAAQRLAEAQTTVCLRVTGHDSGLRLLLDRRPVEVVPGPGPAEVTIDLSAAHFEQLSRGELWLQREILAGTVRYDGPVRKLLTVTAVLLHILSDGQAAPRPDAGLAAERSRAPFAEHNSEDFWALECRNVHKSFGDQPVLAGLDLGIPEGLITVVLGPSGTGKSVLIKHLMGLLRPDEGVVLVRGRALTDLSPQELLELRRSYGVLFQDGALWGSMSVFDNVALPLRQHTDLTEVEIAEVVREQLAQVGLKDAERRMPAELSGGMRKRAGFARALTLDPQIVIFDEPDSGLDPVRTALLADLIATIHAERGGTYVVVSHDIGLARRLADYLAILWHGKIAETGLTCDVLASEDPFVRQFLAGDTDGPLGMG